MSKEISHLRDYSVVVEPIRPVAKSQKPELAEPTRLAEILRHYAAISSVSADNENYLCGVSIKEAVQAADCLDQQAKEIERYRWILVSERLPEVSGKYLTMVQYPQILKPVPVVDLYSTQDGMWGSSREHTHWKPIILPERW